MFVGWDDGEEVSFIVFMCWGLLFAVVLATVECCGHDLTTFHKGKEDGRTINR